MQNGVINKIYVRGLCGRCLQFLSEGGLCGRCLMVICLRPPPLLSFCLEWSSNFVGSESGQIQNVKLLQYMVSQQDSTPPPPSHTLSVYTVL